MWTKNNTMQIRTCWYFYGTRATILTGTKSINLQYAGMKVLRKKQLHSYRVSGLSLGGRSLLGLDQLCLHRLESALRVFATFTQRVQLVLSGNKVLRETRIIWENNKEGQRNKIKKTFSKIESITMWNLSFEIAYNSKPCSSSAFEAIDERPPEPLCSPKTIVSRCKQ